MDLTGSNPLELGLVGLVLLVVYKLLEVVKALFLSKRIDSVKPNSTTVIPLACQQDPIHFIRIKEIHEMTKRTEEEKARGTFECQWKSRDEVRDFMEAISRLTDATTVQTETIKQLTMELHKTRNGHG